MKTASIAHQPCLKTAHGQAVPLHALDIQGRIQDTLAHLTLIQTFRNSEAVNVEAVYTFPLPVEAVLLQLKVTLGERTLVGCVAARPQAEAQYEEALSQGHTAVMLEQVERGLYTLNIGNLLAGECAQIHLHYALPLRWEGDELRLSLPTTLAPRYGDAARAGVQPHQQPGSDALVEYPYRLSLQIGGALSLSMLSSPTHRIVTERTDAGLSVRIADEAAFADRDFVLALKAALAAQSSLAIAADGETQVAHAVFRVPEKASDQPICLKILVDCSGSMGGDSMTIAKTLAMRALDRLHPKDRFSLTAFGSQHHHHAEGRICDAGSGAALVNGREFVGKLDADLGGTEMLSALRAVFGPRAGRGDVSNADVLLITDGETWDRDAIVAAARASGHRIFVIGVGSSPSELLARGIAEATGGVASFLAPREKVAPVIDRHLARMRLPRVLEARLHLPGKTLWQCPALLEVATFAGDTLHVFAGIDAADPGTDAHLVLRYADGSIVTVSARTGEREPMRDVDLPRIGAAQRLWWAEAAQFEFDPVGHTELALRYQLMSPFTDYILVHERGEDAAEFLPELRKVSGMLAAGWGGAGSVMASCEVLAGSAPMLDMCLPAAPTREREHAARSKTGAAGPASKSARFNNYFETRVTEYQTGGSLQWGNARTPRALVDHMNGMFGASRPQDSVPLTIAELATLRVDDDVLAGLRALVAEGQCEESVVLAFWTALLQSKLGVHFGRFHRQGVREARRTFGDPGLEARVASALREVDGGVWCWSQSEPVASS